MGKYCTLCKVVAIKGELNRSFHRFPAPQYQKEKWCQVLNKDVLKLSLWTFVCSDHFSSDSFVYRSNGQRFLKDDALPLPFKGKLKRRKKKSQKLQSNIDHVIIKTECEEQELLNINLDKEIKVENLDTFEDGKYVCVKSEGKYEPGKCLVKTEDVLLKCELTEELDIKSEANGRSSQWNDGRIEDRNEEIFETFQMNIEVDGKGEEIFEQPEVYTEIISKCSTDKNGNILRKMFKTMYPGPTVDSMFTCVECPFKTTLRPVIRRHFLAHRDNEYKKHPEKYMDYKTFHCKQCNYVSIQKYNVSRHMLKHKPKDEKDVVIYFCDHCDYSTKYRCDLTKHRVKHEPDGRRFLCPKCSYKAYEHVHLKRHIETAHIENKRYKFECKKCSYKTDCMGHLNRHMRNIHGIDNRAQKTKTKEATKV